MAHVFAGKVSGVMPFADTDAGKGDCVSYQHFLASAEHAGQKICTARFAKEIYRPPKRHLLTGITPSGAKQNIPFLRYAS